MFKNPLDFLADGYQRWGQGRSINRVVITQGLYDALTKVTGPDSRIVQGCLAGRIFEIADPRTEWAVIHWEFDGPPAEEAITVEMD